VLLVRSEIGLPTAEADVAEWRRLAGSQLETCTMPGGHWDVLKQPVVQRLARELDRRIAAATDGERAPRAGGL
jgi:hypothetical protein